MPIADQSPTNKRTEPEERSACSNHESTSSYHTDESLKRESIAAPVIKSHTTAMDLI